MVVHPERTLAVDLAKVVKVQLADEGLEARVAKVPRQGLGFEAGKVGDAEGLARWYPLWDISEENSCKRRWFGW